MKRFLLVPALVGAALIYAALDQDAGIPSLLSLRRNVEQSHQRIEPIRREVAALRDQALLLEQDEFAIERAIREDLNLAQPGERVVRFSRGSAANPRIP